MTFFLADIMSRLVTAVVIPEVISPNREQCIVVVIRFTISPVKPLNSGVPVGPEPIAHVVVRVMITVCCCSEPELCIFPYISQIQQFGLEPVVDSWMVQFCHPPLMESTENVGIILGH